MCHLERPIANGPGLVANYASIVDAVAYCLNKTTFSKLDVKKGVRRRDVSANAPLLAASDTVPRPPPALLPEVII